MDCAPRAIGTKRLMQKNSPLHVLVIPTWYPNGEDKLIGVYHKLFCTALAEYGVKANMLYVDRQGLSSLPKYPTMQKLYEESNIGYMTYCRIRRRKARRKISYSGRHHGALLIF